MQQFKTGSEVLLYPVESMMDSRGVGKSTLRGRSERFENAIAKLCNWANEVDLEEWINLNTSRGIGFFAILMTPKVVRGPRGPLCGIRSLSSLRRIYLCRLRFSRMDLNSICVLAPGQSEIRMKIHVLVVISSKLCIVAVGALGGPHLVTMKTAWSEPSRS